MACMFKVKPFIEWARKRNNLIVVISTTDFTYEPDGNNKLMIFLYSGQTIQEPNETPCKEGLTVKRLYKP